MLFWPCGQYRTFHGTDILTVYPSQCHKIADECYKYLIYSELFLLLTIVKNYKSIKSWNMFIIFIGMLSFAISRCAFALIKIHNCLYLVDLICHNSCVSPLNYHCNSLKKITKNPKFEFIGRDSYKKALRLGAAHAYDPGTQRLQQKNCYEFENMLGYIMNSRFFWDTDCGPVSTATTKQKNKIK